MAATSNIIGTPKKYDAFISYSHVDKSYAATIQKSIETLGLPFYKKWKNDVNIFRDERKIPLSGNLSDEIINGLKDSRYLLVIASKNTANSKWVKEEIINWYALNKDEDGYITNFNFILIGDVIEWDSQNNDFDKLKTTALPNFENRIFKTLPIWANLQQHLNDGVIRIDNANYQWEIAKIKALLLNKKPDEIINDVSRVRRQFMMALSSVVIVLLLLSGFAYLQRDEAIKQTIKSKRDALRATISDSVAQREKLNAEERLKIVEQTRDSIIKARASILTAKQEISRQNQKINYEAKLKKELNDSREFLKNYSMEYVKFKQTQLSYSDRLINNNRLYFDLDKWNIRPDAAIDLVKTLDQLIQYPNSIAFIETCQLDDEFDHSYLSYDFALKYSKKRAEATKRWLVINGIDSTRIKTSGTVQYVKILKLKTEAEKQLYRKAEIYIYSNTKT